jgi:hypothetical protein
VATSSHEQHLAADERQVRIVLRAFQRRVLLDIVLEHSSTDSVHQVPVGTVRVLEENCLKRLRQRPVRLAIGRADVRRRLARLTSRNQN